MNPWALPITLRHAEHMPLKSNYQITPRALTHIGRIHQDDLCSLFSFFFNLIVAWGKAAPRTIQAWKCCEHWGCCPVI